MKKKKNKGGFLLGTFFGGIIAMVIALFYAPKSGDELRKKVATKSDELLDKVKEYKDIAVEKTVEFYDSASEVAAEKSEDIVYNVKLKAEALRNQAQDLVAEGKKLVSSMTDDLVEDAEEVVEDVTETAEDVVQEVKETVEEFE